MSPIINTIISIFFIVVGSITVTLMLMKFGGGGPKSLNQERATRIHRALGWLFVVLYLLLLVTMISRVNQQWELWPAHISIHVALAFALFVLLALKVSIPRRFPGLAKHLFMLGATTYLSGFVMVWITSGHYLIHIFRDIPYVTQSFLPAKLTDQRIGLELVISKCSTCHLLKEVLVPRQHKDWESIINRMVRLSAPRITPDEAAAILTYLDTAYTPQKSTGQSSPVEQYCSPCHTPDFIMHRQYDRKGWENIVRKMSNLSPDIVPPDKISIIVESLERGDR